MAKIEVDDLGEIATVLDAAVRRLKDPRGISLPDVAGALVTGLSALAIVCREIEAEREAPMSAARARQVADAIVGGNKPAPSPPIGRVTATAHRADGPPRPSALPDHTPIA